MVNISGVRLHWQSRQDCFKSQFIGIIFQMFFSHFLNFVFLDSQVCFKIQFYIGIGAEWCNVTNMEPPSNNILSTNTVFVYYLYSTSNLSDTD